MRKLTHTNDRCQFVIIARKSQTSKPNSILCMQTIYINEFSLYVWLALWTSFLHYFFHFNTFFSIYKELIAQFDSYDMIAYETSPTCTCVTPIFHWFSHIWIYRLCDMRASEQPTARANEQERNAIVFASTHTHTHTRSESNAEKLQTIDVFYFAMWRLFLIYLYKPFDESKQ